LYINGIRWFLWHRQRSISNRALASISQRREVTKRPVGAYSMILLYQEYNNCI
jgi:hypothetical protein